MNGRTHAVPMGHHLCPVDTWHRHSNGHLVLDSEKVPIKNDNEGRSVHQGHHHHLFASHDSRRVDCLWRSDAGEPAEEHQILHDPRDCTSAMVRGHCSLLASCADTYRQALSQVCDAGHQKALWRRNLSWGRLFGQLQVEHGRSFRILDLYARAGHLQRDGGVLFNPSQVHESIRCLCDPRQVLRRRTSAPQAPISLSSQLLFGKGSNALDQGAGEREGTDRRRWN